jgi:hypothetical protein
MKKIDINDYNEIEQSELIELTIHLNALVQKREEEIIKAIIEKDLDALQTALKFNKEKTLSYKAWQTLNFGDMTNEHLDFFIYVSSLPEYESKDSRSELLTKTGTAIYAALHDDKLLDFFLDKPKYEDLLKKIVFEYGLSEKIPKENIKKLLEKDLIKLNTGLINSVLFNNRSNYLEYLIENKLVDFKKDDIVKIYLKNWFNNNKFTSLIVNNFQYLKDIPLNALINKTEIVNLKSSLKSPFYERLKSFVKLEDDIFLRTIKSHFITTDDIKNLVVTFNNLSPKQDEKFHKFVNLIVNEFPEHMATLKEQILEYPLNVEYEKAINYIDLNINLKENENIVAKKIKI